MEKWMIMDLVVSVFVVMLLWIQKYLTDLHRYRLRRMKISNQISIVQASWIVLYAIKYFVLNAVGSIQFFSYMFNH
jgi:hypothetical protein